MEMKNINVSDYRISGDKRVSDWVLERSKLISDWESKEKWVDSYEIYFHNRLKYRYLEPIEHIVAMKKNSGKGFAVVTLLCPLIETIESLYQGKSFMKKPICFSEYNNDLNYFDDRKMFIDFLLNRIPYKNDFKSKNQAKNFYKLVRCGLIHETSTRELWLVRRVNNNIIVERLKQHDGTYYHIINYKAFFEAIKNTLEIDLKNDLINSNELKLAFIRKMNGICQLPLNEGIEKL